MVLCGWPARRRRGEVIRAVRAPNRVRLSANAEDPSVGAIGANVHWARCQRGRTDTRWIRPVSEPRTLTGSCADGARVGAR